MIGRLLDPPAPRGPERTLALIRLAFVPVAFAGERLVAHPEQHAGPFDIVLAGAALYAIGALAAAHSERRVSLRTIAALDFAFLCALTYTSGGPFSQLRFAFFLVPLAAAITQCARITAVASVAVVGAYLLISLAHPATGERSGAVEFELAQGFYLALIGTAATLLAAALAERTAQLGELAASRNRLVAQALGAEQRERQRLSEALHDESIQNLLAAKQELATNGRADLDLVREAVDRSVNQLRDATFELHPYLLQHGGLERALQAVAEDRARGERFQYEVDVDPEAEGVDDAMLFSIGRELLTNAAKHAHANHVRVTVRRSSDAVKLTVTDDGQGLDRDTLSQTQLEGHLGLASAAERLAAAGGRLTVEGTPGNGVTAHAWLPLHRAGTS